MNRGKTASLHSSRNPQGEAERYIESLNFSETTRFFILIEPGLGYMTAPIKKRVPSAKIIALHAEKPSDFPLPEAPDSEWYPEKGISLQDFLETEIQDCEASNIKLVEWRPSLAVYGKAYLSLIEETSTYIKRADANVRTTFAFGSRWFKNFFKNIDSIKMALCPSPLSMPIIVTGAGPGLENEAEKLKTEADRNSIFILAASSSQAALEARGIIPDLVISTDGSQWAKLHLYSLFRGKAHEASHMPLAAALTASLPSQCETTPVLIISDGSFWQTLILKELNIPFITLPLRGTVTATALDLGFALTGEDIYITGMDLANSDISSHARPYCFDGLLEEKAGRFNPFYSQSYKRSSKLKAGGAFDIYASWFKKQLPLYPRQLYSMGKNNPIFGTKELPKSALKPEKGTAKTFFKTITLNFNERPAEKARCILENALKEKNRSEEIKKELTCLLFQGNEDLSQNDFTGRIRSMLGFDKGTNE
jgi:hypothetical protein